MALLPIPAATRRLAFARIAITTTAAAAITMSVASKLLELRATVDGMLERIPIENQQLPNRPLETWNRRRTIPVMYEDSKNSLKAIVEGLQGTDEAGWEAQIETAEAARTDMERIARPDYHRGRGRGTMQGPQLDPNAPKLNKAIPHVRAMLTAMQNRNRTAALEHGKAALSVM